MMPPGLGYRVVVPLDYHGLRRGTLEMGVELGPAFVRELKNNYGGEYTIYSIKGGGQVLASTMPTELFPLSGDQFKALPGMVPHSGRRYPGPD